MIPEKVRVSTGTAGLLGLDNFMLSVKPTTAYLMTHTEDGCVGNCTFCPQARESPSSKSRLSRVLWPTYPSTAVLETLGRTPEQELRRICIQAVNYPGYFEDVYALLRRHRVALCIHDLVERHPRVQTAGWVYLRFHGNGHAGSYFNAA